MIETAQLTQAEKKEEPVNPTEELKIAIQAVRKVFGIDADLVRPGAEAHGVNVTEGNMITPLSEGNYNARIPDGSEKEIEAVRKAKTIAFICEDFRQSHKAAQEFQADVVFASAGGPVQPDASRREAMGNLAVALHRVNPGATFIFAYHTEICGGANHFTSKGMEQIYKEKGPEAEFEEMTKFAKDFVSQAIRAGVQGDRIQLHAVKLHKGHSPEGHSHQVRHIQQVSYS